MSRQESTKNPMLLPRLIRLRDAPFYLGMDRNRFNAEIRPYLIEIPVGDQGVAFDRLDLDAWVEDHKSRNGRPGCKLQPKGAKPWAKKSRRASAKGATSGTSKKPSMAVDYLKALERATSSKPNDS